MVMEGEGGRWEYKLAPRRDAACTRSPVSLCVRGDLTRQHWQGKAEDGKLESEEKSGDSSVENEKSHPPASRRHQRSVQPTGILFPRNFPRDQRKGARHSVSLVDRACSFRALNPTSRGSGESGESGEFGEFAANFLMTFVILREGLQRRASIRKILAASSVLSASYRDLSGCRNLFVEKNLR